MYKEIQIKQVIILTRKNCKIKATISYCVGKCELNNVFEKFGKVAG